MPRRRPRTSRATGPRQSQFGRAGAIGGVGGGQLLQALVPALAGVAGGVLDMGSIVGQLVGGGAGGAILTVIAGLV